jgi:hypothetical protein
MGQLDSTCNSPAEDGVSEHEAGRGLEAPPEGCHRLRHATHSSEGDGGLEGNLREVGLDLEYLLQQREQPLGRWPRAPAASSFSFSLFLRLLDVAVQVAFESSKF